MRGKHDDQKPGKASVRAAPRESTSTLAFSTAAPAAEEGIGFLPKTSDKLLDALKDRLAKMMVLVNDSGIGCEESPEGSGQMRYKNLPPNLRGAWKLTIKDTTFIVGRTRSTWLLVYDKAPESLYEDERFMGLDLKLRDVLATETGKTMFLSRISREDLNMLNAIAAQSAAKKAQPLDTLAPGDDGVFSHDEVVRKLRSAVVEHSTDLFFDMNEFADGIKFMTPIQDASGNHYYIVSGAEEQDYWLYINAEPPAPEGCLGITRIRYKNDICTLYMGGVP
ncbi:MAG: hypothetical protein AB1529_08500 [Candidatus Micrarchaeota archaeon]